MSGADTSIPPGWYADAEVPGGQRWWNGLGWSDYRKSPAEVAASAPAYAAPASGAPVSPAVPIAPTAHLGGQYAGYLAGATPIVDPATGHVPLWAPLYGASFAEAWRRFWRKYADFSGRASRSEFWFAYLGVMIAFFGVYVIYAVIGGVGLGIASSLGDSLAVPGVVFSLLSMIIFLGYFAALIPMIAASVRRLHDAGYPGTYFLFGFIPFAGAIILIVFLAMESKPSGAIYDRPTS